MHLGHDVDAVDLDLLALRRPEGDVQDRTVLGDVDLLAGEHRVAQRLDVGAPGQLAEQVDRLGRQPVLRVVEVEVARLEAHRLAARRVVGEQVAQVRVLEVRLVLGEREPLGRVDDAFVVVGHLRLLLFSNGLAVRGGRAGLDQARSAKSSHSSGTPLSAWRPWSANSRPEPAVRSLTVRETHTSPGAGEPGDARADVHADAADVVTPTLELPGVDAGPDLQLERGDAVADRLGAAHGTRRAVERREHPVAGRLDDPS